MEADAGALLSRKRKSDMSVEDEANVWEVRPVDTQLVQAVAAADLDRVRQLLDEEDADPTFQDFDTGMSVLMAAAASGCVKIVQLLLEAGAPWNAVDRQYRCAGEYATLNRQQAAVNTLLDHAVMSELLLGEVARQERLSISLAMGVQRPPRYLQTPVDYVTPELMLDADGHAVMMQWEEPLMQKHAEFVCRPPVDSTDANVATSVLNVGFGMGLVDSAIQARRPTHHTIIEAHPEVYQRMLRLGWDQKPGVRIVHARWQDALAPDFQPADGLGPVGPFTGAFFDTYDEDDLDLREFHALLPRIMAERGHYSFYNGMCPDNVFFHAVACELARLELLRLGFDTEFEPVAVPMDDPKLWEGVKAKYWYFDTYYLPKAVKRSLAGDAATAPVASNNGSS